MIHSINPTTEEEIKTFKESSEKEINEIIKNSIIAQKNWMNRSKNERIKIMLNVKDVFLNNKKRIINTINEECGFDKSEIEAVFFDVIDGFDYYSKKYEEKNNINFPIDLNVFPNSTSNINFYPLGVIAQIGVWNYPLWQTMITAIPALLVGNSIIYKPSEKSTMTGKLISELINSAKDFPNNIFNLIIGGAEEGKILVKSNKINAICYTGNINNGEWIRKNSGLKKVIFELSGNDPAIICEDCDIDQTIKGVVSGSFLHSGEVCDRIKRIYVVKSIANNFIEKLVNKTKRLDKEITPLIRKEQLLKVDSQVKRTIKDGAELLCGGVIPKKVGYYYSPTILKLKTNKEFSVQNEIFGPVISIMIVKDEDEAIKKANEGVYGLGASVWSQDYEKGERIASKLQAGIVWINDSNIPLVCGEYFSGWKKTAIPTASDRLTMFMKKQTIINHKSNKNRDWWF